MGIFSGLFTRKAAKQTGQTQPHLPPTSNEPPKPEGAWSIIVDERGDPVAGRRPALPTDFLARPPIINQVDGSTYPTYKHDPHKSNEDNVKGYINYRIRSQRNKEHLQKAILLLSQTDDGRRLLQQSQQRGFSIVFDTKRCMEENAVGLCDYQNKQIPLAEGRSPEEVALTLKHELQHMEDIENGLTYDLSTTPANAILANRMLEGNARVSEAVAAAEILIGSPNGPPRQFRSVSLLHAYWNKNHPMARAAQESLHDAVAGKWTSFAAKVFPAYFEQRNTLSYYNDKYTRYLEEQIADVKDSLDFLKKNHHPDNWQEQQQRNRHHQRISKTTSHARQAFTDLHKSPESFLSKLIVRGQPYAQEISAKLFSIDATKFHAVTEDAKKNLQKIKHHINAVLPGHEKTNLLDLPIQQENGASLKITSTPYPYAAHLPSKPAFDYIQMPPDGHLFSDVFKSTQQYPGGMLVRLNYAVVQYERQGQSGNIRGRLNTLLESGFLAPIGAFPATYLYDLVNRLQSDSRSDNTEHPMVSMRELKLIEHWQDIKDHNADPVWIDAKTKEASFSLAEDMMDYGHWAKLIASFLQPRPSASGHSPQLQSFNIT